jgi:ABC-type dipeptide/oligopeptide/nickel transport system permease subunit
MGLAAHSHVVNLTGLLCITIIISLLGWTGWPVWYASRFLALREEDFIVAARLAGCNQMRIIFRAHGALIHEPYYCRYYPGAAVRSSVRRR